MKSNLEKKIILILNRNWMPVNASSPIECFGKMAEGSVLGIQIEDNEIIGPVNWADWINLPVTEDGLSVATSHAKIRIPLVVVAHNYDDFKSFDVKFSKRTLYLLQKGRCWYSGKPLPIQHMNIDHVIPRSRGGKTDMVNCRLCDPVINEKKADRTPEEAGLKRGPDLVIPKVANPIDRLRSYEGHPVWQQFLPV